MILLEKEQIQNRLLLSKSIDILSTFNLLSTKLMNFGIAFRRNHLNVSTFKISSIKSQPEERTHFTQTCLAQLSRPIRRTQAPVPEGLTNTGRSTRTGTGVAHINHYKEKNKQNINEQQIILSASQGPPFIHVNQQQKLER